MPRRAIHGEANSCRHYNSGDDDAASPPFGALSQTALAAHHLSPIQVAALQTQNQHLRRGQIRSHGDIVGVAQVDRLHDLTVLPRVHVVRIREHQNKVDLIVRNAPHLARVKSLSSRAERVVRSLLPIRGQRFVRQKSKQTLFFLLKTWTEFTIPIPKRTPTQKNTTKLAIWTLSKRA